jgi:predicted aminopeptidase
MPSRIPESPPDKVRRLIAALLAAAIGLSSCRTVKFYAQAARGQWEISNGAKPINRVLRDPHTSHFTCGKLVVVQDLRKFAAQKLLLPAQSQYDHYCDLRRKFVCWVLYAAPEFSVEAKSWWYPLLGKLKYRGFFTEEEAKCEGEKLKAKGYDVMVSGTEAYSTLGWLRDPILNTFIHRNDADLAELIFHELTHQRLYLAGDTDFNEALATAVGEEGARRWLRSRGRIAELRAYDAERLLQRDITAAILETRERLKTIYAEHRNAPVEQLRALKAAELTRLRDEGERLRKKFGVPRVHTPPAELLNNASINSVAAYYSLLPGFEKMIAECRGDMGEFFRRAEAMKNLSKQERRAVLVAKAES